MSTTPPAQLVPLNIAGLLVQLPDGTRVPIKELIVLVPASAVTTGITAPIVAVEVPKNQGPPTTGDAK